jgi:hypothetical protein
MRKTFPRNPKWYSILLNDNWCLVPTAIIVTLWIVWLVQMETGIKLFQRDDESTTSASEMLELAVTGTVFCLPVALYRYMRTFRVLATGVETSFHIISRGFSRGAYQDIRIQYIINGKSYTKRFSAYGEQADGKFTLLVNSKKPKHIAIVDSK